MMEEMKVLHALREQIGLVVINFADAGIALNHEREIVGHLTAVINYFEGRAK